MDMTKALLFLDTNKQMVSEEIRYPLHLITLYIALSASECQCLGDESKNPIL